MGFKGKILPAAIAIFLLAGTAGIYGCQPSDEDVITQAVTDKFEEYKNGSGEAFQQISQITEEEGLSDLGISNEEFARAVLAGFDYKIDKVAIDKDSAKANVTIISKSTSDFMKKLDKAMNEFALDKENDSLSADQRNEKVGELAMQAYANADIISEEVVLDFALEGDTWTSKNASEVLGRLDSLVFAN